MSADTLRKAGIGELAQALNDQKARSVDVVAPAQKLACIRGGIVLDGVDPIVGNDGVTVVNGLYQPTTVGVEHLGQKLGIPLSYLRRMRDTHLDLFDTNVTSWLRRDPSSYLLRLLTRHEGPALIDDESSGTMRAFLSSSYRCIDNFDVLLAALKGIREAGITDPVIDADLTDSRMIVRVSTPDVAALAPQLLKGYRSPFGGHDVGNGWTPERVASASAREQQAVDGGGEVVFAGFVLSNSETGGGAFNITPRLVVKVCNNGLMIKADALRQVHLGARLDEGVIKWSDRTNARSLELIASQAADAVKTFLTPDYLQSKVVELEQQAGVPVADASAVVTHVAKKLSFTEAEQAAILGHFVRGGQMTCGGVMQAVTSVAQTLTDGDAAFDMELKGLLAMQYAVAAVRSTT